MPVQFPSLSIDEQTQRYKNISALTLFPYTYAFTATMGATNFPSVDVTTNFRYFTMGFRAPENLAIAGVQFQASAAMNAETPSRIASYAFEVSYLNLLSPGIIINTGTPPVIPTIPADTGNIIYRVVDQITIPAIAAAAFSQPLNIFTDFNFYEPYNYLVKFNQIVYMHVAVDTTSATTGTGTMYGQFILHTLGTGLKI